MSLFHGKPNSSFTDGRQMFMTSWQVFLSDWTFFGQEIFSWDKFWFHGSTQNTCKILVWHMLYQNIFSINDFMYVYEKLIIFIKSLIVNIFWWKKCQTIGLKYSELIYEMRICLKSIFLAPKYLRQTCKIKESMTGSMRIYCPIIKPQVCLWSFEFRFSFIFC